MSDLTVSLVPPPPIVVTLVSPETLEVAVVPVGPQGATGGTGPQGPPGTPGIAGAAGGFTYNQDVPASTWNITHSLGRRPSVTIFDSAGDEVFGDVVTTTSTATLTFGAPFSGSAYFV